MPSGARKEHYVVHVTMIRTPHLVFHTGFQEKVHSSFIFQSPRGIQKLQAAIKPWEITRETGKIHAMRHGFFYVPKKMKNYCDWRLGLLVLTWGSQRLTGGSSSTQVSKIWGWMKWPSFFVISTFPFRLLIPVIVKQRLINRTYEYSMKVRLNTKLPLLNSLKLFVAYRPVAKRWLCKQRPLLGNPCNIHASNNRTGLCNPFISKWSVNEPLQQYLLEAVFSIPSVQSGYKEENSVNHFSWELRVGSSVDLCKGGWEEMAL
jgi:hypothetical protein